MKRKKSDVRRKGSNKPTRRERDSPAPRQTEPFSVAQLQHFGFAVPDELLDEEDDPPLRVYPPGDALPLPPLDDDPLPTDAAELRSGSG